MLKGYTFEKVAIEAWIQKNGKSPITRTSHSKEDLYDNHAITALLEEEKGKSVENMHPSIRNFINAVPPEAPQYCNTSPVALEVYTFPITPEELEAKRLRRRKYNMITAIVLMIMLMIVVVVVFFEQWIFALLILWCMYIMRKLLLAIGSR